MTNELRWSEQSWQFSMSSSRSPSRPLFSLHLLTNPSRAPNLQDVRHVNGKPLVPEHGQSLPIGLAPGKALQYAWSKNCTIHVGGLQGDLEDEANLAAMLQRFGTVLAATVRYRREPATETSPAKVSWALVTFSKTAEMQAALDGEHDGAPFL